MKKIHKYTLRITDEQAVELPHGSEILSVQEQDGELVFWAIVPVTRVKITHTFSIYGTGFKITNKSNIEVYLGTVKIGRLVWHVFYF